MKSFPLLVQERKVKVPAPVWEAVAHTAVAPPPLPPRLSVVLPGKFDCESRFSFAALLPALHVFLFYIRN